MKIRKIDHIGLACRDAAKAEAFYHGVLGLPVEEREDLDEMKLRVVKVRSSEVVLELLEPQAGEETVTRFLAKNGEGIHHLCFEVENVAAATAYLIGRGYAPVWDKPRPGAGGKLVNFLKPKETGGVLIELSQSRA
ncbi:MAG: methylmalonyl-CoA epimerase [Planctomycetes bacterium]|nr:methylmalonyl-CoA epimerase [Planctomycetota bacterium]